MNTRLIFGLYLVAAAVCIVTGCDTSHGGGSNAAAYYGTGSYDPWYYYGDYRDGDKIMANPPPSDSGLHPSHPIAEPPSRDNAHVSPRPMPSVPSRSRPAARGGRGR